MATKLTKDLSRELPDPKALIVTLTETGISLRAKRRRKGITVSWEQLVTSLWKTGLFQDQDALKLGVAHLLIDQPDPAIDEPVEIEESK